MKAGRSWRYRIVVDASEYRELGTIGIGMVFKGTNKPKRKGSTLFEMCEAYLHLPTGLGELLAIYRALSVAAAQGWKRLAIYSDVQQLCEALRAARVSAEKSERTDLFSKTVRLFEHFSELDFRYLPRKQNKRAHCLARLAAGTANSRIATLTHNGSLKVAFDWKEQAITSTRVLLLQDRQLQLKGVCPPNGGPIIYQGARGHTLLPGDPALCVTYGLSEARARLGEVVSLVEKGNTITLTRRGRPVALLMPAACSAFNLSPGNIAV